MLLFVEVNVIDSIGVITLKFASASTPLYFAVTLAFPSDTATISFLSFTFATFSSDISKDKTMYEHFCDFYKIQMNQDLDEEKDLIVKELFKGDLND